ncbi:hypothetical protein OS175_00510 [Marinicella sp. S1101]|uniref:hypothetical protein n=1 Tax=Marinicella marina TaxID=2996016 RepID=UPI002260FCD8|nr:hypothetical protein [Marinicella marina]MCX7552344.1 hypothetical protein [Marinicella marina]MDJ1139219.1 hypothetical protein [Marinicella marina]
MLILVIFFLNIQSYESSETAIRTEELLSNTENIYLAEPIQIYRSKTTLIDSRNQSDKMNLDDLVNVVRINAVAPNATYYLFQVKEVLKGKEESTIIIRIEETELTDPCKLNNDFTGHTESNFWSSNAGRMVMSNHREDHGLTTCFNFDTDYLILNESQFNYKSYEMIKSEDDEWYQFIKNSLNHNIK